MRHPLPPLLIVIAAAVSAAGCGSSGKSTAPPVTVTVVAPTVTVAPTTTPAPTSNTTSAQPQPIPAPIPAPAPATLSPVQVVETYYAAINAHDYRTAWNIGGYNFSSNYAAFVNAFADTTADELTVTGSQGDVVSIRLAAVQSDGSVKYYQGTYTAHGGHLTGASIRQTG